MAMVLFMLWWVLALVLASYSKSDNFFAALITSGLIIFIVAVVGESTLRALGVWS